MNRRDRITERISSQFSMSSYDAEKLLGVRMTRDPKENKEILNPLLRKYHPDKNQGKSLPEMQAVNVLWEMYVRDATPPVSSPSMSEPVQRRPPEPPSKPFVIDEWVDDLIKGLRKIATRIGTGVDESELMQDAITLFFTSRDAIERASGYTHKRAMVTHLFNFLQRDVAQALSKPNMGGIEQINKAVDYLVRFEAQWKKFQ